MSRGTTEGEEHMDKHLPPRRSTELPAGTGEDLPEMSLPGVEVHAEFERPPTLSQVVINRLRNEIFHGALVGGKPLREADLSSRFGVSRNTIREALHQLSNDKLVTIHPHRGASVRALDARTVEEAYSLRLLLEPHAVKVAFRINAYDPERLAVLDGAVERMRSLGNMHDVYEQTQADYQFHLALCSACRHSLLLSALQTPQWITRLCMIAARSLVPDLAGDAERHQPLVEAVRQGPRQATRALSEHLRETSELILSRMSDARSATHLLLLSAGDTAAALEERNGRAES